MITINANTKISAILKAHPDALEAIISVSPKFNKLRNPILRKLMASRITVSVASKVGGCRIDEIFDKLVPLGFNIDRTIKEELSKPIDNPSGFLKNIPAHTIDELDVRPVINSGKDPFSIIMEKINGMDPGRTLKLINSFEPAPLISLMKGKGYETFTETIHEDLVYTYFRKPADTSKPDPVTIKGDWQDIFDHYQGKIHEIDVRQMEMPKPMHTILSELGNLPKGKALLVYHKRVPVFLIPEIEAQGFDYRIKEIAEGEVNMIIFHK